MRVATGYLASVVPALVWLNRCSLAFVAVEFLSPKTASTLKNRVVARAVLSVGADRAGVAANA